MPSGLQYFGTEPVKTLLNSSPKMKTSLTQTWVLAEHVLGALDVPSSVEKSHLTSCGRPCAHTHLTYVSSSEVLPVLRATTVSLIIALFNHAQVFVNGYRHFFPAVQMLSEETEPEKADTKLYNPALPAGLTVRMGRRP